MGAIRRGEKAQPKLSGGGRGMLALRQKRPHGCPSPRGRGGGGEVGQAEGL